MLCNHFACLLSQLQLYCMSVSDLKNACDATNFIFFSIHINHYFLMHIFIKQTYRFGPMVFNILILVLFKFDNQNSFVPREFVYYSVNNTILVMTYCKSLIFSMCDICNIFFGTFGDVLKVASR